MRVTAFAVPCVLALVVGAAAPAAAQAPAAPAGNADSGRKLYVDRACWQCHGLVAQGGGIANVEQLAAAFDEAERMVLRK